MHSQMTIMRGNEFIGRIAINSTCYVFGYETVIDLFSFCFCVLEKSMIKDDVMVTQQQMDGLWPEDWRLVRKRSGLSDISHTSNKSSSLLFSGSAEKETDLTCTKMLSVSWNHCLYLNYILWGKMNLVIIFNWHKRVEMQRSTFH